MIRAPVFPSVRVVAVGSGAGLKVTGAYNNIVIGHCSGNGILHGNNNVIIGDWIAGKPEDNQFVISPVLPTLVDSQSFLLYYQLIVSAITPEWYPNLSRSQIGKIHLTLRRLRNKYEDILRHEPIVTGLIPTILCQEILPHYQQHPLFTDWVKHEILSFC